MGTEPETDKKPAYLADIDSKIGDILSRISETEKKVFGRTLRDTLYCSFCGKSQHEVRKLIAGPTVFICNECVDLCVGIVNEVRQPTPIQTSSSGAEV